MRALLRTLVILLVAVPARAEPVATFEQLAGEWSGPGTFQDSPSTVTDRFETLHGGKYWRLTSRTVYTGGEDKQDSFVGEGTYATGKNPMTGTWIDDTGEPVALQPAFDGNALVVRWGPPGQPPVGRSVYALNADGTLTATDSIEAEGKTVAFATAVLTKVK